MQKPFVIGIGYKARHGKDYVAQLIHDKIPHGARIYSFASALKSHCRIMGWMEEKNGPILQYVGTELYRKKAPDIWVKVLKLQIEEENPRIAIIPDVRFPNEKEWIEKNGISVKIERYNQDGSLYITADRPADHPSEIALDGAKFDYEFKAVSGDLEGLNKAANQIIEVIISHLK